MIFSKSTDHPISTPLSLQLTPNKCFPQTVIPETDMFAILFYILKNYAFDRGTGPARSLKNAWFSTQNFQNAFAEFRDLNWNRLTSEAVPSSLLNLIKNVFCLNETFLIKLHPHVLSNEVSWKTRMPSAPAERRQELPWESRQLIGLAP